MDQRIQTVPVCDIADCMGEAHFVTFSIGPNLDPLVLSLEQPPLATPASTKSGLPRLLRRADAREANSWGELKKAP